MKTTSPFIIALSFAIIISWVNPSAILAKELTGHQKNLRQEAQYLVVLEQAPDKIETRILLAQLYLKKNRYSKAIIHFKKALAAGSKIPDLYINIAFSQQQSGDIGEAIQTCKQGITANPNNDELHLRLGNLYHRKGMNDQAESEYSLYQQLHDDL